MVRTKKMDEGYFAQLIKDLNAFGELVRARQEEKQALLDQFDDENKRFVFGKISEKAFSASVKKTNLELERLDRDIRNAMTRAKSLGDRTRTLVVRQQPERFRATLSGLTGATIKPKKSKKHTKKRKRTKKRKMAGKKKSRKRR